LFAKPSDKLTFEVLSARDLIRPLFEILMASLTVDN
jgi:hypothetical protein